MLKLRQFKDNHGWGIQFQIFSNAWCISYEFLYQYCSQLNSTSMNRLKFLPVYFCTEQPNCIMIFNLEQTMDWFYTKFQKFFLFKHRLLNCIVV